MDWTPQWFIRNFEPLLIKAKKAGIDPKVRSQFLNWIYDHRNSEISSMWGTINKLIGDFGLEEYHLLVEEMLEAI